MLRVSIGLIWMKTSALRTCWRENLPAKVRIRSRNGWKNERRSLAIPHRGLIPCLTNMTTIAKQIPEFRVLDADRENPHSRDRRAANPHDAENHVFHPGRLAAQTPLPDFAEPRPGALFR